jgi:thymidylate synthase
MIDEQIIKTIHGKNLSHAWAEALVRCSESSGAILSPAVVHFPVGQDQELETPKIRQIIDKHLAQSHKSIPKTSVIETVAGTIFPQSIWLHSHGDRKLFFKLFNNMFPFVRRCRANSRGHYFQRMISYLPASGKKEPINQLEHIITTWHKKNHRHSAHQIGIFDPRSDHSDARQRNFPCLQQVAFHAKGTNGEKGLSVIAFYANQTLVEKAYGNYLGLYRLGIFMAKEMGLQLNEIVCVASALKLNNTASKSCCKALVQAVKPVLNKL